MTGLWLTNETGTVRESFAAGETVLAAGRGLQRNTLGPKLKTVIEEAMR